MSIKIMSAIWERGPVNHTERFVLLAIADFCNDQGECWPSVAALQRKTCMTDRGIQKIIRRLETDGWLAIHIGQGMHNCNLYIVKTPEQRSPRTTFTPNDDAKPPNHVHRPPEQRSPPPRTTFTAPPNTVRFTPEHGSPKPSGTIIEPSVDLLLGGTGATDHTAPEIGRAPAKPASEREPDDCSDELIDRGIDAQLVEAWAQVRKAKDAGPITKIVIAALVREAGKAGISVQDAIQTCCERGWLEFSADRALAPQRLPKETPAKGSAENRPPSDETTSPPEKPPDKAKGTRLPEDWHPGGNWLEFTRNEGLSDEQARRQFEMFSDYWRAKPGADGRKSDWLATWRNWVRRSAASPQRGAGGATAGERGYQSGSLLGAYQRAVARLRAQDGVPDKPDPLRGDHGIELELPPGSVRHLR